MKKISLNFFQDLLKVLAQKRIQVMSNNFSKTLDPKDFGMEDVPKIFCTNYQIFIETLE